MIFFFATKKKRLLQKKMDTTRSSIYYYDKNKPKKKLFLLIFFKTIKKHVFREPCTSSQFNLFSNLSCPIPTQLLLHMVQHVCRLGCTIPLLLPSNSLILSLFFPLLRARELGAIIIVNFISTSTCRNRTIPIIAVL